MVYRSPIQIRNIRICHISYYINLFWNEKEYVWIVFFPLERKRILHLNCLACIGGINQKWGKHKSKLLNMGHNYPLQMHIHCIDLYGYEWTTMYPHVPSVLAGGSIAFRAVSKSRGRQMKWALQLSTRQVFSLLVRTGQEGQQERTHNNLYSMGFHDRFRN